MKVFYRPEQSALNAGAYSPSAGKPALVVQDWLTRGLIRAEDLMSFEPVTRREFKRAHASDYVDGVLDLRIANGFNNRSPEVAASLPWTSGSLLAAARYALTHQENTCPPTSGFHHAGHAGASGYCTFNGLMVTVMALQAAGEVDSVGILDCDAHYGDGTHEILQIRSVRGVRHHTMGRHFNERRDVGDEGAAFFAWLDRAMEDCRGVDLLIYQAGADPHVDDPLGGMLTSLEMARRDEAVFAAFKGRALVWNLAGGYQRDEQGGIEPVLALHRTTAEIQNRYQSPR